MENEQTNMDGNEPKRPSHLFKKGQSGNPNGRPKGSSDMVKASDVRQMIGKFIKDAALPDLFKNFEKMNDKNKIEFVTKLMPYFTPTLSATKLETTDGDNNKIKIQLIYDTSAEPAPDDDIDDAEILPDEPDSE